MYINANVNLDPNEYIGGQLYESDPESEFIGRTSEIFECIYSYGPSILVCRPDVRYGRYLLWGDVGFDDINELLDSIAIKDGVDLIDHQTYLELVAYYSGHKEVAYLYPISQYKCEELMHRVITLEDESDYYGYALDDAVKDLIESDGEDLGTTDAHYILQSWA